MLRKNHRSSFGWVAIAAALVCSGCGSSSKSTFSQNALTPAQAQAVSHEVAQAVVSAVSSSFGVTPPPAAEPGKAQLGAAIAAIHPEQSSSGCVVTSTGETCNFPLSFSGPCPAGGTIAVSGDINGTLDNSGNGSLTTQVTVTPSNCGVSNLTFSGDPNVMLDGQVDFTNSGITFPITLTEVGGISYGPNPSGSCQLNVTYTIHSQTSCTASGTVCGQSISGPC
jgi:hypothetical protein